jgi:hypothetical protein
MFHIEAFISHHLFYYSVVLRVHSGQFSKDSSTQMDLVFFLQNGSIIVPISAICYLYLLQTDLNNFLTKCCTSLSILNFTLEYVSKYNMNYYKIIYDVQIDARTQ